MYSFWDYSSFRDLTTPESVFPPPVRLEKPVPSLANSSSFAVLADGRKGIPESDEAVDTPIQVLSTRLFAPPSRPRLVDRMSAGLTRPLALVSAPAGFGNITLLSEGRSSAAGRGDPAAYISLDSEDNDLSRFPTCLAAAWGV